jgi:hypothetical protein
MSSDADKGDLHPAPHCEGMKKHGDIPAHFPVRIPHIRVDNLNLQNFPDNGRGKKDRRFLLTMISRERAQKKDGREPCGSGVDL